MKTIKSDIFRYSDALENEFKRELRRELVAPMIKTTTKTILDLYRKNKAAFKMEVKDAATMDANAYDIIDQAIKRLGKRFYDLYVKKGAFVKDMLGYCQSPLPTQKLTELCSKFYLVKTGLTKDTIFQRERTILRRLCWNDWKIDKSSIL